MARLFDRLRNGLLPARQAAQPYREQGVAGFVMSAGVVQSNERHHELLGSQRWKTAADLLANVSIIAAGLRYSLNLTARPKWKLDPPSDKPEAKAAAEFAQDVIESTDRNWARIVRSAAMYRYHGFGINEWVASKRDDGKIGIQTVESRPQHTIERWDIDDNGGVKGVFQRDPQTSKEIYLPRQKIVYLVDDMFTDSPTGLGLFRHLVEPANALRVLLKLERIGFQRDLVGIPIGRVPLADVNALVASGKITAEQRDDMIQGIRDFVSLETKSDTTGLLLDSEAYVAKTDTGASISSVMKWGVDLITGEQNSVEALGAAIKRMEFDMALVMGTSSLLTGREGEGSRALSEDQSRNLYLTVNQSLKDMSEAFDRDIIGPLWAMNGLDEELRPKLTTEDASFKDVEQIAATLQKMAAAGAVLAPDDPAINDVRNLMGISEAEEMSVEDLALIRGAGKTPPGEEGGTGGGKPGKKPSNSNEPGDAPSGSRARRGAAQKWASYIAKMNPNHVPSGEHGGEFTTGSGGGGGSPVTIPRRFQPRNFAQLKEHPAVESIDDDRPNNIFVNLAPGFAMSEQHSFGVETVGEALRLMREVEWEGDGPPPWTEQSLSDVLANIVAEGRDTSMKLWDESRHPRDRAGKFTFSQTSNASYEYWGNGKVYQSLRLPSLDGGDTWNLYEITGDEQDLQMGSGDRNHVGEFRNLRDATTAARRLIETHGSEKFNPNHVPSGEHGGEFASGSGGQIEVGGKLRPATDSTGRRIAKDEEGVRNFWNWYGDSVLVDDQGRPIRAYHGTSSEFEAFGRIEGGNAYGEGFYFTTDPKVASDYAAGENVNRIAPDGNAGPNVIPAYLKVENPLRVRQPLTRQQVNALEAADNKTNPGTWKSGELWSTFDYAYPPKGDNVLSQLRSPANDVIRDAGFDSLDTPYGFIVFKPTQIKAITNRGTFDPNDPGISKFNPNHEPAGSSRGGQFASASGGGGGPVLVKDSLGNTAPVDPNSSLAKFLVKNPDGSYSLDPEREKLHKQIVADYLSGVAPTVGQPEMFMTGGGPASGKSSVLMGGTDVMLPGKYDAVHVDPDAIKFQLPEMAERLAAGDKTASSFVHEESSLIRRRLEATAIAGNYNVVLDTTGDSSVDKLERNLSNYRAAGYRVNAIYATNDVELAQRLNHQRFLKTGRLVPETFLRDTHRDVTRTFEAAARDRRLFDRVQLYDTNIKGEPRLVASGDRQSFSVRDGKLWNDFLDKGKGP